MMPKQSASGTQRHHPRPSMLGGEIMASSQVSEETGIPGGTLRFWRATGQGPKWFRIGDRKIGYLRSDVEAWLAKQYASTD
jgi:predicted DNA-binding transcriptional regulator AlpA